MAEIFQKAIEDLTREEAQAELREAWEEWRGMDGLCDQARDWAVAANSLRVAALEALEEAEGKLEAVEGRLSEIVEECEEVGEDPSYLFSMLFLEAEADRILKEGNE